MQFAVHPAFRRQGIGHLLFKKMGELDNPNLSILNVEDNDLATNTFLRSIGFQIFIQQFEPVMKLWQKSDKFWLFSSLVSFAVLYLNLIWKTTADIDRLTTESLFWIAILWLLWLRRDKLNVNSNLFSTSFGLVLICLVLAKSFSLFGLNQL